MMPTLTHDARTYLIATVVTGSAGAVSAASLIYVRRLHQRVSAIVVYSALLGVLAGGGFAAFGVPMAWHSQDTGLAVTASLLAGPAAGWLASRLDIKIARALSRGRSARPAPAPRAAATNVRLRPVGLGAAAAGAGQIRNVASATSWVPARRNRRMRAGPALLVADAVLEECVFRGALVSATGSLSGTAARMAGLVAVVAAFALCHVFVSWAQVVAKLPLSVLCTVLTVATGTLAGAAVAHALMNWQAWRQDRATAPRQQGRVVRMAG